MNYKYFCSKPVFNRSLYLHYMSASVCLSVSVVCLSVYLSVCLVCLSVCLSVCLVCLIIRSLGRLAWQCVGLYLRRCGISAGGCNCCCWCCWSGSVAAEALGRWSSTSHCVLACSALTVLQFRRSKAEEAFRGTLSVSLCLSLSMSLSVYLCLSLNGSPSIVLCISLFLFLFLPISVSLTLPIFLCVSMRLSASISLSASFSLRISLYLPVSLSLRASLSH